MELTLFTLLGGAFIALIVGLLTGIFGVGGGFLMTPALMIVLHIPGAIAVGTGLGNFLANSSAGLYHRRGTGTIDFHIAAIIGGGSLAGVMLGSRLLEKLGALPDLNIRGRSQDPVQLVLMCAFFLLLSGIAVFMCLDLHRTGGKPPAKRIGSLARVRIPPYGNFRTLEHPHMSMAALASLGVFTGFLTGLLGIGGGVVLLPALIYLVGLRAQKAAGTSLLLVWSASLLAFSTNLLAGNINWPLLSALLAGGMTGTALGTHIGLRLSGPELRIYFVPVLIAAIVLVSYKIFTLVF